MLTVGSLFSGIGGIELGLERTKYFKTLWFVENNGFCQRILKKHWPDVPIFGDISEIDWTTMPRAHMLAGGFPCQDISTANPRGEGIEGSRSGLWKEYAKAIGILRPKYALIENVPALVNRGLNVVLADLAEAGYDAEWFDLRASDFGALHRRGRIFIIAHRGHAGAVSGGGDGKIRENGENEIGETTECLTPDAHGNGLVGAGLPIFRGRPRQDNPCDKDGVTSDPHSIGRDKILPRQSDLKGRIVADDYLQRADRFWQKKIQGGAGFSWCQDVRRVEDLSGRPDIPEPLFRGTRDGVPDWVDRIKSLGNAVVPDCAEFIGELIMEHDKKEASP